MSIRAMIRRWVTDPWVADDPNPLPSQLDLIGGTYDIVHAALARSTTVFGHTSLLTPPQLTRAARTVTAALDDRLMDLLRDAMTERPDLAATYADRFEQPAGEQGDVPAMRAGVAALAGPHERDDRWREFGRTAENSDGRGRDL